MPATVGNRTYQKRGSVETYYEHRPADGLLRKYVLSANVAK